MTEKTIKELIETCIKGQGNQVDLGSVLGTILGNVSTTLEINDYEEFLEGKDYEAGEIVRYDGKLYIFTRKHLYGEWDKTDVREINMAEVVGGIKITYDALKYKRDNSLLKVGEKYRITDYVATTFQPETRSAEHPFDIIVEVISENALSENATATQHEGDTYFSESHLGAWQIKYSLDNDTFRFAWAVNQIQLAGNGLYVRMSKYDTDGHWAWVYFDTDEQSFYVDDRAYTDPNPIVGGTLYMGEGAEATSVDSIVAVNQGKGVIYHMIDEYNNECPYDFKGIQFLRSEDWCNEHVEFTENVLNDDYQDYWFYTFSLFEENREIVDVTIVGNSGKYTNDEGKLNCVFDNKFGICDAYSAWYESFGNQALGKSVFVNFVDEEGFFYGCYGNVLLANCYGNTFGNNCYYNTFGNNCSYNTFGNYVQRNTFGNNCIYNTFGNDCYSNTFGNGCYSNTFGNECNGNTFGNDCYNNTFGNYVQRNTFGNECNGNTFGNNCIYNTFGNGCYSNTFGNECNGNTFGNDCYNNTFGNYVRQLTVFEGVVYCAITGGNSSSSYVQNAQILNGTQGQNSANRLTINFQQNKNYTQMAGLNSGGTLTMWTPADDHQ